MPLTFIDIEKQKNWRIWLFFLLLMLAYLLLTALVAATFLPFTWYDTLHFWVFAGTISLVVSGIHFWFSAYDTVRTVVRELGAQQPDPQDDIHRMLMNIMQEFHVVTGNRRRMQCVVIPSLSLNALAVADLKGEAAIGITEGLLSRLTRPQLETVIAHEAHHILSGDCLETTVAASLFGTYSSAIEKFRNTSEGRTFISPTFVLAWVLLQLSYLLNMFISREREYRADAASVRMTRNPIALAETLYLLSRSWRGAGFIGSGFEMLCIVNPQATALDETEGFWADLLSTHPPLRKRMDILLKMAHTSIAELDAKAANNGNAAARKAEGPRYYAMNPQQQWLGPFTLDELGGLAWLSPLTWVTTGGKQPVDRAWKQPIINAIFTTRLSMGAPQASSLVCPSCSQPLVVESYENTQVYQCRFCAGTLLENNKIARIIARTGRERPCSNRINALTRAVVQENQVRYTTKMLHGDKNDVLHAASLLPCPKCRNSMYRSFYSSAHMIEIDRCSFCELTWFDRDELEMLQCLIENRIEPRLGIR